MITSLAYSNGNIFAGTMTAGVFLSSDSGINWTGMNTGLVSYNTTFFLTDKSNVFAATKGGGILLTTDHGKSWTALNNGLTNLRVNALAIYDSTIYASTYDGIFKSTDYGNNWKLFQQGTFLTSSFATSDSILYVAAGYNGVIRSIIGNETWSNIGLNGNFIIAIEAKDSLVLAGSNIYKGVFYSSDYGNNWKSIGAPYAYSSVYSLGWVKGNIIAGIDYGVYITSDMGQSWVRKDPYNPNPVGLYTMVIKDSIVIASTFHGIYLSKDYGENWITINSGLNGHVYAVAIVDSIIFAGDEAQNIWKTTLSKTIVGINDIENKVPQKYFLSQNYPNPFNPSTIIRYVLPSESKVTIKIYNLLGQEIKVLANYFESVGYHEVTFDASNLSSGVYFYRIVATALDGENNFVDTKKLLLLK